jgi:uncharacterized protein YcbX
MSETIDIVNALHIFPIKSCHEATVLGQLPSELHVGQRGFEQNGAADRGWVVDDEDNLFVTQRGWNRQLAVKHPGDKILATVAVDIQSDHLAISAEGYGQLFVPLNTTNTEPRVVTIFGPELPVIDEGEEAASFFSALLGRSVRLAKADPTKPRMLPDKYQRPGAANQSAAADGRPFTLASQASLDHLHDLSGWERGRMPLSRYRANIDMAGAALGPFGEDTLRTVRVGDMTAYIVKALTRCPIPNVNQDTGSDEGRLSTKLLRPFRMGWAAGEDTSGKAEPFFAQSLNHIYEPREQQIIRVGDPLVALETGEPNVILKR